MRTWKDIKMEVLGLLFSRTNNGRLAQLTDQNVLDYVNEMPDAANAAMRDIAANAVPLVHSLDVEVTDGERVNLRAETMDGYDVRFIRLSGVLSLEPYAPLHGYQFEAPHTIIFPEAGKYRVLYDAYPEAITKDTADDYANFELPPDAMDAVLYRMAWHLYLDDDISVATSYLNLYYERREELMKNYKYAQPTFSGGFTSVTGWS